MGDIYRREETQKIGGEYLQASVFYEDVTTVVEKGKPIQLINRKGKVKATLDKIDGNSVTKCTRFKHGLAIVTINGLKGAIDTNGDLVIQPEYIFLDSDANGHVVGIHKKYKNEKSENAVISILNKKGKEVASIKCSKFKHPEPIRNDINYECCIGDGILVSAEYNNKTVEAIMGFDGEWILKPTEKILRFHEIRGKNLTYSNNDGYGLTNLDGDILIRPKFTVIRFLDDELIAGQKSGDSRLAIYNLEGEKVSKDDYEKLLSFHDGKDYTLAKVGNGDYTLINRKGEEKRLKADVYNITYENYGDTELESDYVDPAGLVNSLKLTKDGFLGLTTSMAVPEAIETLNGTSGLAQNLSDRAEKYKSSQFVESVLTFGKATIQANISIEDLLQTKLEDRGFYVSTEYSWSPENVSKYVAYIGVSNNQQLQGKMSELYTQLADAAKALGKEVKKGKNATVVDVGNGNYYWVYSTGDTVNLEYGHLNVDECATTEYDNVSEENPYEEEYDDGPEPGFDKLY